MEGGREGGRDINPIMLAVPHILTNLPNRVSMKMKGWQMIEFNYVLPEFCQIIKMPIQCILAYPNLAYPNPRISEQPKAGLYYS